MHWQKGYLISPPHLSHHGHPLLLKHNLMLPKHAFYIRTESLKPTYNMHSLHAPSLAMHDSSASSKFSLTFTVGTSARAQAKSHLFLIHTLTSFPQLKTFKEFQSHIIPFHQTLTLHHARSKVTHPNWNTLQPRRKLAEIKTSHSHELK